RARLVDQSAALARGSAAADFARRPYDCRDTRNIAARLGGGIHSDGRRCARRLRTPAGAGRTALATAGRQAHPSPCGGDACEPGAVRTADAGSRRRRRSAPVPWADSEFAFAHADPRARDPVSRTVCRGRARGDTDDRRDAALLTDWAI